MDIFNIIKEELLNILSNLQKDGKLAQDLNFANITVEPPRDLSHGDVAINAAMVLAKPAKKNPRELANILKEELEKLDIIVKIEIAGPGFINITLDKNIWYDLILDILKQGDKFGESNQGKGEKINIEFVSTNPTGPMHIGHTRGAIFGDALSIILKRTGYDVTKEYYINDAGSQIDVLANSAYLRYKQALGIEIGEIPQGLYPGSYLIEVGEDLAKEFGDKFLNSNEDEYLPHIKKFTLNAMMQIIKNDLKLLGIEHDVYTSEQDIQDRNLVQKSLDLLDKQGLIYQGKLEPPKGKLPDDWEEREQTLFKSTNFGDDLDRALKKSDGSWTYFASDCAYHLDKIERGFDKMAIILGADHSGYIKRLKAIVKALSGGKKDIDVKITQIVNFLKDGKVAKMSKRAGTYESVEDVLEEVDKDIIRFIMLTRKNDIVLDFDFTKVKEQSKDNPVFYVQYAHARACSVLRMAQKEFKQAHELSLSPTLEILKYLTTESEIELIKLMANWPRILGLAALHNEPHRIAFYLQDLAACFHSLWNKGKDEEVLRFIVEDNLNLTAARLSMICALTKVISSALLSLNIKAISEMR